MSVSQRQPTFSVAGYYPLQHHSGQIRPQLNSIAFTPKEYTREGKNGERERENIIIHSLNTKKNEMVGVDKFKIC